MQQLAARRFPINDPIRIDTSTRICDRCSVNMILLSELPEFHDHAAAKIFRCYACGPHRANINRDGSTVGCTPRAV
jgi:hypothetical protein